MTSEIFNVRIGRALGALLACGLQAAGFRTDALWGISVFQPPDSPRLSFELNVPFGFTGYVTPYYSADFVDWIPDTGSPQGIWVEASEGKARWREPAAGAGASARFFWRCAVDARTVSESRPEVSGLEKLPPDTRLEAVTLRHVSGSLDGRFRPRYTLYLRFRSARSVVVYMRHERYGSARPLIVSASDEIEIQSFEWTDFGWAVDIGIVGVEDWFEPAAERR